MHLNAPQCISMHLKGPTHPQLIHPASPLQWERAAGHLSCHLVKATKPLFRVNEIHTVFEHTQMWSLEWCSDALNTTVTLNHFHYYMPYRFLSAHCFCSDRGYVLSAMHLRFLRMNLKISSMQTVFFGSNRGSLLYHLTLWPTNFYCYYPSLISICSNSVKMCHSC